MISVYPSELYKTLTLLQNVVLMWVLQVHTVE